MAYRFKHTHFLANAVFIAAVFVLFVGCGAGKTLVMKPLETDYSCSSISVSAGKSTIPVPDEVRFTFEEKIDRFLFADGPYRRGGLNEKADLTIEYRFLQFNPGNQFARWFWGGIGNAGQGSITVEAKFFDAAGKEVSKIQSEGEIQSGAFGGSFNYAIEKSANEIADFTVRNFRPRYHGDSVKSELTGSRNGPDEKKHETATLAAGHRQADRRIPFRTAILPWKNSHGQIAEDIEHPLDQLIERIENEKLFGVAGSFYKTGKPAYDRKNDIATLNKRNVWTGSKPDLNYILEIGERLKFDTAVLGIYDLTGERATYAKIYLVDIKSKRLFSEALIPAKPLDEGSSRWQSEFGLLLSDIFNKYKAGMVKP